MAETLERRDLLAVSLINLPGTNPPGQGFTAGEPFAGQIATFVAADGATNASEYSGTMNWGDGSTTAVTIAYDADTNAAAGGTFDVSATHTYRAPGPETLTLTIQDGWDTTTAFQSAMINVADQALTPTTNPPALTPGVQGTMIAPEDVSTFNDANPMALASDFSATIQWGDGSSTAASSIVRDGGGTFHVDGGHTYQHPSPVGGYQLSVQVTDGPSSLIMANSLVISPSPLVFTTQFVNLNIDTQNSQGQAIIPAGTVVGSFTQAGALDLVQAYETSASFVKFNGSAADTPINVQLPNGQGPITVTTAADTVISPLLPIGPTSFNIQVADIVSGAMTTTNDQLNVYDVAPTAANVQPTLDATMGAVFSSAVAAFNLDFGGTQDLSSLYRATIDWGDGSPTTDGTVVAGVVPGSYVIMGTHTYADIGTKINAQAAGTEPISVTMRRNDLYGASDLVNSTMTVADAPIVATASPVYENASTASSQGAAIVPAGMVVGTFTQAGGPRLTTAYGGSTATFTGATSPTPLSLTFDPTSGIFTARTAAATVISPYLQPGATAFTLQIVDAIGGSTGSSTSVVNVADVSAIATATQPTVQVVEGRVFAGPVTTFTLPYGSGENLSSQLTATINWGDGTAPTVGIVQPGSTPGTYQVIGNHIYAGIGSRIVNVDAGTFPVLTTVTRSLSSGTSETFADTATVLDAPLTLTATTAYLTAGSVDAQGRSIVPAGTVVGTFQQVGGARLASDYSATVTFAGSSASTPLTITALQNGNAFLVVTAAPTTINPYLLPGASPFQLQLVDNVGGATAGASNTLDVADVAPIATAQQPTINITQGRLFDGAVVRFGLPFGAGQDLSGLYAATINWGDGSPSTTGIIQAESTSNTYVVIGNHLYTDIGSRIPGQAEGTSPVSVTLNRLGPYGSSATIGTLATVLDAPILVDPATITLDDSTSNSQGAAIIPGGEVVGLFTQFGASRPTSAFSGSSVTFAGSATSTPLSLSFDPSTSVYTARTASSTVISPYLQPGQSPFTINVVDGVGGSTMQGGGSVEVADVAPVVSAVQPVVFANLNTPFSGAVAAFSTAYGLGQDLSGLFATTINWGDGSPSTSGTVKAGSTPGSYLVFGSHTYTGVGTPLVGQTAGTYQLTIMIIRSGGAGSSNTTVNTATVADAPIAVSGALSAASDSGTSASDGITNNVQPVFSGTSQPGSTITLFAVPAGTDILVPIGSTSTDASGSWSLTTIPLADGIYTVNVASVDRFGMASAATQLMPNAHQGPLEIQTHSPKVTNVQFLRNNSQVALTFECFDLSLNLATLLKSSDYSFAEAGVKPSALAMTGPVLQSYDPSGHSATVLLTLNGGHKFPTNSVNVTINGSTIKDIAGNALDGSFQGSFPSGNGQPGSNFNANVSATAPPRATPRGPMASAIKASSISSKPTTRVHVAHKARV